MKGLMSLNMTMRTKPLVVVMPCWRNGLKWTALLPGGNCLLSLSHMQCPAVLLIKVTNYVCMYVATVAKL